MRWSSDNVGDCSFEAAWAGDLEKIKKLTLHPWGDDESETPLKIVVVDGPGPGNSPWSLAFFRGHYDVAWGILEIAHAQYCPPDEKKVYQIDAGNEGSDSEVYSDSDDDDDDDEPRVVSKIIDENFTIDNVGEVSMQVKSKDKALSLVHSYGNTFEIKDGVPDLETCVGRTPWRFFADGCGDWRAFKRYLDMCLHFGGARYEADPDAERSCAPVPGGFIELLEKGKVRMLKEFIKRTGAGIPLDYLVKQSGIEVAAKPRYYQGLTVYGKKRKDWATAGRNMYVQPRGLKASPVLHAALHGQREMVEWLLGDEPLKLYTQFSKKADDDSRLKHLNAAPGRFESVVSKWLGNRSKCAQSFLANCYPIYMLYTSTHTR